MFTVTESVEIARGAASVFEFLTDPARRAEWDRSVVSERLLSPPPVQTGSAIRTRMSILGRDAEYDWRVTVFEPPAAMALVSTSGMMPTRLRFDIADTADGSRVTATIEGSPEGMLRLAEPIISETVRSTFSESLQRAKALLEAG